MTVIRIASQSYEVDALLFDKDGTLLNLNHLWCGWLEAVIDALIAETPPSIQLERSPIYTALGVRVHQEQPEIDPRGPLAIGSMEDVMTLLGQVLYQHYGVGWNDALRWVHQARTQAEAELNWSQLVQPIYGVQAFIAAAQAAGIPMGVVTSDEQQSALEHLRHLKLDSAMDVVIGHDQVTEGKPFPEMVEVACHALEVKPERVLLFGDSNGDMQMAQTGGLIAGIGIAPQGRSNHLTAATQVIEDYKACQVLQPG